MINIIYSAATSCGMRSSNQDNAYISGKNVIFGLNGAQESIVEKTVPDISAQQLFSISGEKGQRALTVADSGIITADESERKVFGIFDGVGSVQAGEDASAIAAMMADELENNITISIADYYEKTNAVILDYAKKSKYNAMATTALICEVKDKHAVVANAGDCRAYLVRGRNIRLLSEDHFRGAGKMKKRLFGKYRRNCCKSSEITRFLGGKPERGQPEISSEIALEAGDRIVLCSDGVYSVFSDNKIKKMVRSCSPFVAAMRLVERAISLGGDDNATAVVLSIR